MNDKDLVVYIMESLETMDGLLERKDINATIKEVHQCMARIKPFLEGSEERKT